MIPFGDLRIDLVPAGHFSLDGGALFGIVPRVLWERKCAPDEKNRIELALNCLLIRDGKRTALVETGMGEQVTPRDREIYCFRSGRGLVKELEERGVRPESVDTVILTHLHFDHAGGATTRGEADARVPSFPRARYIVQRTEWEFAEHPNERTRESYRKEDYEPILRTGQMSLVEGEVEIFPGVKVVPLPGHTPGMQGVLLRGGGRTAFFPSDLLPTAAHAPYPYIMAYDLFPLTTLETRKRVFPQAAGEGWILILVHEPRTPVGVLREEGSRFRFQPREEEA